MKAPHCVFSFPHRATPTTCLTSASEGTKESQEGETKRKESPGWYWSHQSTTPTMAFQGEKTWSSRLSRSVEMYCIYADIKNKNYKEKKKRKREEKEENGDGILGAKIIWFPQGCNLLFISPAVQPSSHW